MLAFYSDHFVLPLPPGHRFPMSKYRALRERVAAELPGLRLAEPEAASAGELALAHDPDYIDRVFAGRLDAREQRVIGFPWSAPMVERSRRSTGATIAACRRAIAEGVLAQETQLGDWAGQLATSGIPRLVIFGGADAINPPDPMSLVGFAGRTVLIPEAGHLPHIEAARQANAEITQFLQGLAA